MRSMAGVAELLPPEEAVAFLSLGVNIEKIPSELASMLGVNKELIRTEEERNALGGQMAKAQAAQAQLEQQGGAGAQ